MSDISHLEMKLHRLNDKIGKVKHDVEQLTTLIEKLLRGIKTIAESKTNERGE